MGNFSIIGKFIKLEKSESSIIIYISTTTPFNKNTRLPIICSDSVALKIKENDLLGIHGYLEYDNDTIKLIASKIIWLPNK